MITETQLRQYRHLATEMARDGGQLARSLMGKTSSSIKSDKSVVTEADTRVQDLIVRRLMAACPDHGLIGEEETSLSRGRRGGDADYVWTVDPIDGTRNFAAGVSVFSCSVALLHQGRPIAAAIYEPNFDWLFTADAAGPAEFNGRPVTVSSRRLERETVFGISINTYGPRPRILHTLLSCCLLRNFGSTALHLAMVGAGLMDGCIHFGGKLWDIAAGALIVERAGGIVRAVDHEGIFLSRPLWPLDLAGYKDAPLPFAAGNPNLLHDLENDARNQ